MQAVPRAAAGKRASNSALNSAWVHQQSGWGMPVRCWVSMAHSFGWPHSGQRVAPGDGAGVFMQPV
jgi:hypothetical protein